MKRYILYLNLVMLMTINIHAWVNISNNLPAGTSVFTVTSNGTELYIGTSNGVYFSSSQGSVWNQANAGLEGIDIYSFAFYGNNIYTGSIQGIFSSSDNGTTWSESNQGLGNLVSVYTLLVNNTTIFAGTDNGLFRTDNAGQNWTEIPLFSNNYISGLVKRKIGSLTYIFAGTSSMGIYVSTNNGSTWTSSSDDVLFEGTWISALYINDNGNIYAGDYSGFAYKSTNNGTSWELLDEDYNLAGKVNSFASYDNKLYAGLDYNGIFYSLNDGVNWVSGSDGVLTGDKSVNALYVYSGILYAGTQETGIFSNTGAGAVEMNGDDLPDDEFFIYPVPAGDFIKVGSHGGFTSDFTMTIYNFAGCPVSERIIKPVSVESALEFNIGELPEGMYYCVFKEGFYSYARKFSVIR